MRIKFSISFSIERDNDDNDKEPPMLYDLQTSRVESVPQYYYETEPIKLGFQSNMS
jgi:hypothetical protein